MQLIYPETSSKRLIKVTIINRKAKTIVTLSLHQEFYLKVIVYETHNNITAHGDAITRGIKSATKSPTLTITIFTIADSMWYLRGHASLYMHIVYFSLYIFLLILCIII